MRRTVAISICILFLVTGVIRISVGCLMFGQALQWWSLDGEAAQALADTRRFISERSFNWVGFTPVSYFAFIALMGVFISLGAMGGIWKKRWGLVLIGLYLLCHFALFVNFMTLNPKVLLLALAVLLTLVLWWANGISNSDASRHTSVDT